MKNLITCLVVCVLSGAIFADTWTVDDDGKADFTYIQGALQIASDGDEILVMPGTYTGGGNTIVNTLGKEVWLHSSGGPEVTIIDGEGMRRGIECVRGETSDTIIEGFTITGGFASEGGGMRNISSSPTLTNCTFTNNTATSSGGGMDNNDSNPTLENCTFENNAAIYGGGMYNSSSNPSLTNCTFTSNHADDYSGGGMHNNNNSSPTVTNCTFTNNTAWFGGGMCNLDTSNPVLTDTTVCDNSPDQIWGDNWTDNGGNTIADICPECPDINGDGYVDVIDLLAVIDVWGCDDCSDVDVNLDDIINLDDLLIVFNAWGPCE